MFLDYSPDIPTQPIRSIPVLDHDPIHATHIPPPNTTPTDTNIAPSAPPESPAHATPSHNFPAQQSIIAHDTPPHIQHTHVAQQTPEMDHEQPPMAQNEISPLIIPNPPENSNPDSVHTIVAHFCVGTNRPTERLNLHVSSVSPLLKSYWQNVMRDEYNALIKNRTWVLVPRPTDTNIVRCMWLFRHKYLADGTLSRYKARLVANGSTQLEGVNVDEIFSLIIRPGTIQTVLSFIVSRHWPIHQLDVKNAFLHGDLSETVCMHQPPGLFLSQKKYAIEILDRMHMVNCSLQYLTFTRPDISYAVQQPTLSHSSAEAEYHSVANVVAETCWLCNLLRELHTPLSSIMLVYCDNVSAVYLSCNPVPHRRTKHIKIDIHFVRDLVVAGQVRVLHVPSCYHFMDILTKGLPSASFEEFRSSLSV
ncbi:ribonuclease H-like domain-containing protein [Tanacetum coccineum]